MNSDVSVLSEWVPTMEYRSLPIRSDFCRMDCGRNWIFSPRALGILASVPGSLARGLVTP